MEILQAVIIGLTALIVTPGFFFYFDVTPKIAVLLIGTAAALLGGAFSWDPSRRPSRAFTILVGAQVVSLALSTAISERPALSLFGSNWRRYGAVVQAAALVFAWLIAWHAGGSKERVRSILRGIVVTAMPLSIYGIAQYFGWDPLLSSGSYHIGEGFWTIVRPPGTLGYVSYFATWLLFSIFLALALALLETSAVWRRLSYCTAGLALAAMILTGTRAALVGALAGACVWLWRSGRRMRREGLLAGAGLCALAAAFYFSPMGQPLRSRVRWFVEDPWGGARIELWRDSLAMAMHRPVLGYGPEVFTATFPAFESEKLARAYPDFIHESPHNILLDAAVAQGLPGLAILCGLLVLGFRTRNPAFAAALAAGVVAQQFTAFTLPTALITFVTVALAAGKAASPQPASRFAPAIRWAAVPAAIVLIYTSARLTASDHALSLVQKEFEAGDGAAAAADYANYDRLRLPGSSADLWYSRASMHLAQRSPNPGLRFQALIQAGAAAVRATQTSEDPVNAWYSLATFYAAQNDGLDTEKCLRSAIAANPHWFKPHWTLAQVLRMQGRLADAEAEARIASRCNGGKNPEVSQTLADIRAQRAAQ